MVIKKRSLSSGPQLTTLAEYLSSSGTSEESRVYLFPLLSKSSLLFKAYSALFPLLKLYSAY